MTADELGNFHGYACPACDSGQTLKVACRVWATLLPDGADTSDSDNEWEDDAEAMCECGWSGKVNGLKIVEIED